MSSSTSGQRPCVSCANQTRVIVEQQARIAELEGRLLAVAERLEELERQVKRGSQNSSKPPSSDGLAKPPVPRSLRNRSGRRPGKQGGAPGAALAQVAEPDEVIDHVPRVCGCCGQGLADAAEVGVVRRQVHDLPQVRLRVVEHRLHRRRCGTCRAVTRADAPEGVTAPAVYGPGLAALAVYLLVFQHVPVARCAQLIADVTGAGVSAGWVHGALIGTSTALAGFEDAVKQAVTGASVAHFDETGARVAGGTRWLHTACTTTLTCYFLHDKRGSKAMDAHGVLPAFRGIAVHDGLASYRTYPFCAHALCNAHHLRELIDVAESHPREHWPQAAIDGLHDLNTAAHTARAAGLLAVPDPVLRPLLSRWDHAVLVGRATHANRRGPLHARARSLLKRLATYRDQVLRFAFDLSVPFTNNQAERDLRMIKAQLKISGCWRTRTGAQAWLRIRSYISTTRKNHIPTLQTLRDAITGNPWLPALPTGT